MPIHHAGRVTGGSKVPAPTRRADAQRRVAAVGAALMLGCSPTDSQPRAAAVSPASPDSFGVAPLHLRTVRMRARRDLTESSAAAVSVAQPSIIFTINDSGHDAILFAFDTTGADRGAWRVDGARNVDWEAAAFGPCGEGANAGNVPRALTDCIYIGETGDNDGTHVRQAIYRIVEPVAESAGFFGSVAAERLAYRYADGPRDVEAMYVAPDGTINLITKRPLLGASRLLRPALIYRIPLTAWNTPVEFVASPSDSLPIVPGSALFRQPTDAALSPDGHFLAVRTYHQVFIFATDSSSGAVRANVPPALCNIADLDERQGEGIGWIGADRELVLTSEGRAEPLRIIRCPLPAR